MQQIIYDQAPYHILYYDAALHAYRTDRFEGWQNQPTGNGVAALRLRHRYGYTAAAARDAPRPVRTRRGVGRSGGERWRRPRRHRASRGRRDRRRRT